MSDTIQITARLPREAVARLDRYAAGRRWSRAVAIRALIEQGLEAEQEQENRDACRGPPAAGNLRSRAASPAPDLPDVRTILTTYHRVRGRACERKPSDDQVRSLTA